VRDADPPETDGDDDTPDEPAIEREVEEESAELDDVRAAEKESHVGEAATLEGPAGRAAARLGLESPIRFRLRQALGRAAAPSPAERGAIPGLPEIDHDLSRLQAEFDIPIEVNDEVVDYVRFFQSPRMRPHFVKWLARSYRYGPLFRRIMREEGLPEDTIFLAMIESGFSNLARSRARAVGTWQFISATGRRMGLRQDFWVDERRDPEKAARAAARYLKELYAQTGDWRLAWAGYNAGVGRIFRARARGHQDFWSMARGRALARETRGYVPKLMAAAIIAKHAEAFGFGRDEVRPEPRSAYEEVTITRAMPLGVVATAAGVSEQDLLDLNPELRRACSPPWPYVLKIPKGKGEAFARNWPRVSQTASGLAFSRYRVRPGESISRIARRYSVDQVVLARMNGLEPGRRVKAGTELVIPVDAQTRARVHAFARADRERGYRRPVGRRLSVAVRRGDTLSGIAQRFGVAVADLGRWNSIGDPRRHKLLAGAHLVVYPHRATSRAAGGRRASVAVRAGDTLWGIARRFGVELTQLCRWNGIRNPHRFRLHVGRVLVVYPRGLR
jgi:membrane-bound lytic murein transglycosylase D